MVPTPIGNLSDISLRALSVLRECEILFCEDTRVAKSLINLLNTRFDANINIQKFIPLHTHNEDEILPKIELEIFDKNVAFLSDAGMPGISDPGAALVNFAIKNGIAYEVLAVVASGLCEKEFCFLGFLPNNGKERAAAIQNALNSPFPAVIYESPKRILSLILDFAELEPDREIFAIKEATKKFETKFRATASELAQKLQEANLSGEWCVVIQKNPNFTFEKITQNDILELEISPKAKSKLLAKITGRNAKEIYAELTR